MYGWSAAETSAVNMQIRCRL